MVPLRCIALFATALAAFCSIANAQFPIEQMGEAVPRDVREMYERGLQYLASSQESDGSFGGSGSYSGPGVTGMGVMAFLASGEDPNFGLYSGNVRRGLRNIIGDQDADTGILGGRSGHSSMYNHGFAMLALAEAYGAVDDRQLWPAARRRTKKRSANRSNWPSAPRLRVKKTISTAGGDMVRTQPMPTRPSVAR